MSKPTYHRRQDNRKSDTGTQTTVETKAVESPVEDTQTIDSVIEETKETPVVTEVVTITEHQQLVNELGVKSAGRDITTGQEILPNTPMLRRMKELAKSQQNSVSKTNKTLTEVVKEKYGEQLAKHPTVINVVSILSEYVERMSPENTVTEEAGASYQLKLARLYDSVLNAEPELAMVCLEIIVATVTEHITEAFSERFALRFINVARLNPEQAYRFHMLTTLFIELGRRANQKNPTPIGESVNIQKLMDFIPDRNAKANLAEFLS